MIKITDFYMLCKWEKSAVYQILVLPTPYLPFFEHTILVYMSKLSNCSTVFFIIPVCSGLLTKPKSRRLSFSVCIGMSLSVLAYGKVLIKKTI